MLCAVTASLGAGVCLGALAYRAANAEREAQDALLRAVLRQVERHYVQEVPRARLVDDALRGVLAGLDDHSSLLDERALVAMQEDTVGSFGGVGVTLGLVRGHLTIIEPLPDTPAARAGVHAGDRLLQVDHQPVRHPHGAASALRGRPDTAVHVRVSRAANTDRRQLDFEITRALIALSSVRGRVVDTGYGYLRIHQFNKNTADELGDALAEITAAGPLDGLVLDLRDNPGGLLLASVAVADAFLTDGVIVSIASRAPAHRQVFEADADAIAEGVALAVLVNRGSASAAEVVASALQHHGRAAVIGTESYGKASVQTVLHFPKGRRAVKLTTARYRTPAGRSLDQTGVVPDIVVAPRANEPAHEHRQRVLDAAVAHLRERDLAQSETAPGRQLRNDR